MGLKRMTPIVKEPNPILHQRAAPVREITAEILCLIDTMIKTMHAAQGVGLAANQVGSNLDILVASPDGKAGKELVLLNAALIGRRGRVSSPEGCLSLPGLSAEVHRSAQVTATGLNRQGEPITLKADGLLARILQHEVDHLKGDLFLDRLGIFHRRRLLARYRRMMDNLDRIRLSTP